MFTLVPGLVCTWLVDVPSAHAPRRNEYRRLQTAIQTYDPVYNNWVERSVAGMFVGLLYLFDVPTFLSSLTNFIQTYASLYPKQVGRKS